MDVSPAAAGKLLVQALLQAKDEHGDPYGEVYLIGPDTQEAVKVLDVPEPPAPVVHACTTAECSR